MIKCLLAHILSPLPQITPSKLCRIAPSPSSPCCPPLQVSCTDNSLQTSDQHCSGRVLRLLPASSSSLCTRNHHGRRRRGAGSVHSTLYCVCVRARQGGEIPAAIKSLLATCGIQDTLHKPKAFQDSVLIHRDSGTCINSRDSPGESRTVGRYALTFITTLADVVQFHTAKNTNHLPAK